MASSISARTIACRTLFVRCLSIRVFNELDWFENRQGEFSLWDSGLKAADVGRASLDYRVRDRPDLHELICGLLDGLSEALGDCLQICMFTHRSFNMNVVSQAIAESKSLRSPMITTTDYSPKLSNTDVSDFTTRERNLDSTFDVKEIHEDFSEQAFNIKTILDQLARISTAIRRSGAKLRYERADLSLQEQDFEEFKAHLTFIVLMPTIESYSEGSTDGDAVPCHIFDQGRLTTVQKRLIQANIIRRNRILFATQSMKQINDQKRRREEPRQANPAEKVGPPVLNTTTSTTKEPGQPITDDPRLSPVLPSSIITPSIAQSSTELGSQFDLQAVSRKKATPSVMTKITQTGDCQDYPTCPAPVSDEFLQCPYCANLLPVEYSKTRSRWK